MTKDYNVIRDYVRKCLASELWSVRAISEATGISKQSLYSYARNPASFNNMSLSRLDKLYSYFHSFDLDVEHIDEYYWKSFIVRNQNKHKKQENK